VIGLRGGGGKTLTSKPGMTTAGLYLTGKNTRKEVKKGGYVTTAEELRDRE